MITPQQYQISGPAIHAARTLFRNWRPREIGRFEATLRNVAIMIDVATQIFKLQQQLDRLLRVTTINTGDGTAAMWTKDNLHELSRNIEEVREVIRVVEMVHKAMAPGEVKRTPHQTTAEGAWKDWRVSVQAQRAAKSLMQHYTWEQRVGCKSPATEAGFSKIIDACIDAWRANVSLPLLIKESGWETKDFGANFLALRRALADMELLRNHMPRVAPGVVTVAGHQHTPKQTRQEPTAAQRAAMKPLQEAFARAGTVSEAAAVITKAGIATNRTMTHSSRRAHPQFPVSSPSHT